MRSSVDLFASNSSFFLTSLTENVREGNSKGFLVNWLTFRRPQIDPMLWGLQIGSNEELFLAICRTKSRTWLGKNHGSFFLLIAEVTRPLPFGEAYSRCLSRHVRARCKKKALYIKPKDRLSSSLFRHTILSLVWKIWVLKHFSEAKMPNIPVA